MQARGAVRGEQRRADGHERAVNLVGPRGVKVDALGDGVERAALERTYAFHELQREWHRCDHLVVVEEQREHEQPDEHLVLGQLRDARLLLVVFVLGGGWRGHGFGRLWQHAEQSKHGRAQRGRRRDVRRERGHQRTDSNPGALLALLTEGPQDAQRLHHVPWLARVHEALEHGERGAQICTGDGRHTAIERNVGEPGCVAHSRGHARSARAPAMSCSCGDKTGGAGGGGGVVAVVVGSTSIFSGMVSARRRLRSRVRRA